MGEVQPSILPIERVPAANDENVDVNNVEQKTKSIPKPKGMQKGANPLMDQLAKIMTDDLKSKPKAAKMTKSDRLDAQKRQKNDDTKQEDAPKLSEIKVTEESKQKVDDKDAEKKGMKPPPAPPMKKKRSISKDYD